MIETYTIETVKDFPEPDEMWCNTAIRIIHAGITLSGAMLKLENVLRSPEEMEHLTEIRIRAWQGKKIKHTLTYPSWEVLKMKYAANVLDDAIRTLKAMDIINNEVNQ